MKSHWSLSAQARDLLLLGLSALCAGSAFAGNPLPVRLRILDPDGRPVSGAQVLSRNANTSCTTDENGNCSLQDQIPAKLEITARGFATDRIVVSNTNLVRQVKLHINAHVGVVVSASTETKTIGSEVGATRTESPA